MPSPFSSSEGLATLTWRGPPGSWLPEALTHGLPFRPQGQPFQVPLIPFSQPQRPVPTTALHPDHYLAAILTPSPPSCPKHTKPLRSHSPSFGLLDSWPLNTLGDSPTLSLPLQGLALALPKGPQFLKTSPPASAAIHSLDPPSQ